MYGGETQATDTGRTVKNVKNYLNIWDDEHIATTLYRETEKGRKPIAYYNREQSLLIIDTDRFDARDLPEYVRRFIRKNGVESKH